MKKQEYIDLGVGMGISPNQIENTLCKIIGVSKADLFKMSDISSKYIYEVQQVFFELQAWWSEEYVFQVANFYGRDFFVDERVLIPRNDTEVLVKNALKKINLEMDISDMIYADVWTWSWCIAVSVISEMYPLVFERVVALEFSPQSIDVAIENIEKHVPGKIEIMESNLLSAIFHDESLKWKKLCITANLPYIKDGDYDNMDESVVRNEPNTALYGWAKTGFELYEWLIKQCFQMKQVHKLQEIHLFIEIWFDQKAYSEKYLRELWLSFEYFLDSSKIERVIYIKDF